MAGCLIVALFVGAACETISDADTPLNLYADIVADSLASGRRDRGTMRGWSAEFQVKQVDIAAGYRLDMMRHRESFHGTDGGIKWQECLQLHKSDVANSEAAYYAGEAECLRATTADQGRKRHAVYQVEKEIKKWRKSYRYLLSRCRAEHPGGEAASGACLADYMRRDNYHGTFQRLDGLKVEAMLALFRQMEASAARLQDCLRSTLSEYLSDVRRVAENVHQCYSLRNKVSGL